MGIIIEECWKRCVTGNTPACGLKLLIIPCTVHVESIQNYYEISKKCLYLLLMLVGGSKTNDCVEFVFIMSK